LEGSDVGEGE
jgi:hypothetical protein